MTGTHVEAGHAGYVSGQGCGQALKPLCDWVILFGTVGIVDMMS